MEMNDEKFMNKSFFSGEKYLKGHYYITVIKD